MQKDRPDLKLLLSDTEGTYSIGCRANVIIYVYVIICVLIVNNYYSDRT